MFILLNNTGWSCWVWQWRRRAISALYQLLLPPSNLYCITQYIPPLGIVQPFSHHVQYCWPLIVNSNCKLLYDADIVKRVHNSHEAQLIKIFATTPQCSYNLKSRCTQTQKLFFFLSQKMGLIMCVTHLFPWNLILICL